MFQNVKTFGVHLAFKVDGRVVTCETNTVYMVWLFSELGIWKGVCYDGTKINEKSGRVTRTRVSKNKVRILKESCCGIYTNRTLGFRIMLHCECIKTCTYVFLSNALDILQWYFSNPQVRTHSIPYSLQWAMISTPNPIPIINTFKLIFTSNRIYIDFTYQVQPLTTVASISSTL